MKKWIIIIASVATVIIATLVVCLGIINKEPQVEIKTGEYFEDIPWDMTLTDVRLKVSSRGYDVMRGKFYTKSNFAGLEDATAAIAIAGGVDGEPYSFVVMFSATSDSYPTSVEALNQLYKGYEEAFDKLTDKKITKKELAQFTDASAILGDENITWITENSCLNLMYTKDKKLTISYESRGTEYSDFIETCIKNK